MHSTTQDKMTIFDFAKESSSEGWYVVNDGVMGGLSRGRFNIEQGLAVFKGQVSTDNNGGFTMIQNRFRTIVTENHKAFVIELKGDGKDYQFRVKSDKYQQYSYVSQFSTTGEWETITIPFSSMEPRFRGRALDLPNFNGTKIEEIAFLIGNKRDESFELQISNIQAK
ncbi:CIA30 family protein [Lutimonas sp.]|jgi:NADH dehydrogenase [ubiquinone] 1 alpha subcomplex assembly factor 1|uniref:CIA30 family protein n=1 Tax=Lutimonas sp. TaxID=1872403 RepID=UPI003C76D09A